MRLKLNDRMVDGLRIKVVNPDTGTFHDEADVIDTEKLSPERMLYYTRVLKQGDLVEVYGEDL